VLIKTTAILGAIFLINTLVLARLTSKVNSNSLMANEKAVPAAEVAPQLPAAPELPVAPELPAAPAPAAPAPANGK
jgi:preprotein translocase subunit SecG